MNIAELLHTGLKVTLTERDKAVLSLSMTHGTISEQGIKNAVASLLRNFGVDLRDPNFIETPRRVSKLYSEWLKPKTLEIKSFPSPSDDMVCLVNHRCISVCPHHLLPFDLVVDIAYIPTGHVVGLSKLARLANFASGSFLLQENITQLNAEVLNSLLLPKGVAVRVTGVHGCMRYRGVFTEGHVTTSAMRGTFMTDEKARSEFYHVTTNGKTGLH